MFNDRTDNPFLSQTIQPSLNLIQYLDDKSYNKSMPMHNESLINLSTLTVLLICLCFPSIGNSAAVVVNGGQVTLSGTVTNTQIDLMLNYTANVKWIAMIWGPDEVNTDTHLFLVDSTNAASPVQVKDCYIDELSAIVYDDVSNIQPSVTSFSGDISTGLKVAYNRDLSTGDSEDIRLYTNSVVQVCFISSTADFVGNGSETGHEKVCSFLSLHQQMDSYFDDRLLGNYAGTTLIGGANLTFYATQSTDGWSTESWLFMSVVHKQQGLNPYTNKWLGVTYVDSLTAVDLAVLSEETLEYNLEVHTQDMYAESSSSAKKDESYVLLQGGDDVVKIYGAYQASSYFVASYKRKFETGDVNRDSDLTSGDNTFCFLYGDSEAFSTLSYSERVCINLTLSTSYFSNFRVTEDTDTETVIEYTEPTNNVVVIKKHEYGLKALTLWTMAVFLILFKA